MPLYSATIQYKETKGQWTISLVKRTDGKGYTPYSIEAMDDADAEAKARALYASLIRKNEPMLADPGNEELILLVCPEPRHAWTVNW